jgi:hypothetical protein
MLSGGTYNPVAAMTGLGTSVSRRFHARVGSRLFSTSVRDHRPEYWAVHIAFRNTA